MRQPGVDLIRLEREYIGDQLRQIELRIDLQPSAGAGKPGQDGRGSSTTFIPDNKAVLPVEDDPLHLALTGIIVNGHCGILKEGGYRRPLVQRVVDRIRHRMLGISSSFHLYGLSCNAATIGAERSVRSASRSEDCIHLVVLRSVLLCKADVQISPDILNVERNVSLRQALVPKSFLDVDAVE